MGWQNSTLPHRRAFAPGLCPVRTGSHVGPEFSLVVRAILYCVTKKHQGKALDRTKIKRATDQKLIIAAKRNRFQNVKRLVKV